MTTVRRFAGFPDRTTYVPLPAAFFGTLLREIDDLAELKTLLHVCRLLHEQRRGPRFVRRSDLLADLALLAALDSEAGGDADREGARIGATAHLGSRAQQGASGGACREEDSGVRHSVDDTVQHGIHGALAGRTGGDEGSGWPERCVERALCLSVRRGTLLEVAIHDDTGEDRCYLLNTHANERVVQAVMRGERTLGALRPSPAPREPDRRGERPTIFELYEQNVGLLTPLLAEELSEAAATYPPAWIEDAFREALAQNKRSWRYILRILEAWGSRGRGTSGTTWRRPEPPEDPRRYLEGKYGRLVRR
ncbi:MAG: DnaD domain protein [Chloroflexi bacterium]|nr:DnaD domain protein [Chloroflexota bacterium]